MKRIIDLCLGALDKMKSEPQRNDFVGFPVQNKTGENLSEYLERSPKQTSIKGIGIVEGIL